MDWAKEKYDVSHIPAAVALTTPGSGHGRKAQCRGLAHGQHAQPRPPNTSQRWNTTMHKCFEKTLKGWLSFTGEQPDPLVAAHLGLLLLGVDHEIT